jgi:hypothetical protein
VRAAEPRLIAGVGPQTMIYHDGTPISLGDIVSVPVPMGSARARVVMLGDTYDHLDIDQQFLSWVSRDRVLEPNSVVIEWLDNNPFVHNDPQYAPVGNYMFSPADEWLQREGSRA